MQDSSSFPSEPLALPLFRSDPVARWLPAAVGALATLGGCDSDFEPYNELTSLRVLAIESTPVSPLPGEVSTLTPLLYVPDGEAVTSSWSWCPLETAEDDTGCPLGESEASSGLGAPVTFDLGSEPTARFEHGFPPEALARLCSGAELSGAALGVAPDCTGGLPIQIRYVVRTSSDEVVSVRRLLLRFSPEHLDNQNPVLSGVAAAVSGAPVPLDDAGAVLLPRDTDVELSADIPESSSESVPPGGPGRGGRERLALTWFIDAGETRYERTSFVDGALPLERATRNTWTLPSLAEHASDVARLIVVVRDDRGGVGWRTARVMLGGTP